MRGIGQLPAPVSATDIPQAGQAVDVTVTVGIEQVRTLRPDPDLAAGMGRVVMQRVNHVLLVFLDKIAITQGGIHSGLAMLVAAGGSAVERIIGFPPGY